MVGSPGGATGAPDESANLDLLRSVAVLLVLLDHVLLFLGVLQDGTLFRPIGRLGVLLFFVHTALVLLLSLDRQQRYQFRHPYGVFLLRRTFRILPLSLLAIAVVTLFRLPLGHFEPRQFLPAHFDFATIASDVLLIQNLTQRESVLDPLWSLPYEMQMYLVLPALFVLCRALSTRHLLLRVSPILALVALVALLDRVLLLQLGSDVLHFVPCFLGGVVAYQLWGGPRRAPAAAWPLVLALVGFAFLLRPTTKMGWLCCLIVGAAAAQFREQTSVPLRRACALISRYSYGIYLSHGLCIWLCLQRLADWPAAARWALMLTLTALLPVILYHAVEAPLIRLGSQLALSFGLREKKRSIAVGVA